MSSEKNDKNTPITFEKENKKEFFSIPAKFHDVRDKSKPRAPLKSIADNYLAPKNCTKLQPDERLASLRRRNSASSSAAESSSKLSKKDNLDKNVLLPNKVTVRQLLDKNDEKGEVFIHGPDHFLKFTKENTNLNKESENLSSGRKKVIPAQKKTLVKKLSQRKCLDILIDDNRFYNSEYFIDNFEYMLLMEAKFVFRKSYLENRCHSNRIIVIDWLVYVQEILGLHETSTFVAVRLFDKFLITTRPDPVKYIIIGVVCLWIASKFIDSRVVLIPKLFAICDGKFSRQEFRSTEVEILKTLDFDLNVPDPISFLSYYFKHIDIEKEKVPSIYYGTLFYLEMYMLCYDFSSNPPSLLAAVALYSAMIKFDVDVKQFLEYININLPGTIDVLNKLFLKLTKIVQIITDQKFGHEIVSKYSTGKTLYVAQKLLM